MTIFRARCVLENVGGAHPAQRNARLEWSGREGIIVKVIDENETAGTGEASPLPGYSRDALPATHAALRALSGLPLSLDDAAPREACFLACNALPEALPAARFGVETAVLDLLARRRETSLASLLRASDGLPNARRAPVVVSALLSPAPASWTSEVASLWEGGYRTVKAKIGRALPEELAAIAQLRERWPDLSIRLDANGTLSAASLPAFAKAVRSLRVELVEEPTGGPLLFGLAAAQFGFAIDESLSGNEALALGSQARALVLKPTVVGGLWAARDLALAARAAGKDVIVTHCFEGPWALASAAELALSLPFDPLPCGLARHGALSAFPPHRVPTIDAEGAVLSDIPRVGHGVVPC